MAFTEIHDEKSSETRYDADHSEGYAITIREWIPSVLDDVADGDELGIEVIVVGLRVSVPVPTLDVGII